jgi:hypothetical protein
VYQKSVQTDVKIRHGMKCNFVNAENGTFCAIT